MAKQIAELDHALALGEGVIAQICVLDAIDKVYVEHPQVVADPGHAGGTSAGSFGRTYSLDLVALWSKGRRKRIEYAPDIDIADEAQIQLAIRAQKSGGGQVSAADRHIVCEQRSGARKNYGVGRIDFSFSRTGRIGNEADAPHAINAGN